MKKNETKFNKIRADALKLKQEVSEFDDRIMRKYGFRQIAFYQMNKADQNQKDKFRKRQDRLLDRMMKLLEEISPRYWRSTIPAYWVLEELTYEDAITDGQLVATPPAAYGYTETDVQRFCRPTTIQHTA
jgi:hypothetical protein